MCCFRNIAHKDHLKTLFQFFSRKTDKLKCYFQTHTHHSSINKSVLWMSFISCSIPLLNTYFVSSRRGLTSLKQLWVGKRAYSPRYSSTRKTGPNSSNGNLQKAEYKPWRLLKYYVFKYQRILLWNVLLAAVTSHQHCDKVHGLHFMRQLLLHSLLAAEINWLYIQRNLYDFINISDVKVLVTVLP